MRYVVEGVGTFFLVLTIALAAKDPNAATLAPIAVGAVLVALVYAGGHVSGAHYNPAVTLALLLRGACPARDVAPYIAVQLAAAVAAGGAARVLAPAREVAPLPIDVGAALLAELLFTFALCFVILNVATARGTAGNGFFGVAIGLVVMAGAFAVGGISGAAFNPAVVLALGLLELAAWGDLWIHLVGELAGALLAVLACQGIPRPDPAVSPEVARPARAVRR